MAGDGNDDDDDGDDDYYFCSRWFSQLLRCSAAVDAGGASAGAGAGAGTVERRLPTRQTLQLQLQLRREVADTTTSTTTTTTCSAKAVSVYTKCAAIWYSTAATGRQEGNIQWIHSWIPSLSNGDGGDEICVYTHTAAGLPTVLTFTAGAACLLSASSSVHCTLAVLAELASPLSLSLSPMTHSRAFCPALSQRADTEAHQHKHRQTQWRPGRPPGSVSE